MKATKRLMPPSDYRNASRSIRSGSSGGGDPIVRKSLPAPVSASSTEVTELESLNSALRRLVTVFPDVRPEVFREMLGVFPDNSRLQVVIETLLKNKAKWVKGRWRVQDVPPQDLNSPKAAQAPSNGCNIEDELPRRECFRTSAYKEAVKLALYQEFKGLSHSAIKAVLAEHNHVYLDARLDLLTLASKSWRYSFATFLSRRKPIRPEESPLVAWQASSDGKSQPFLLKTQCEELNEELEASLIAPLKKKQSENREKEDERIAERMNEEEASAIGDTYDCECCFSSFRFERVTTCASSHHCICFDCVRRSMSEAVFGQSWAKSIDVERATLRCIAVGSDGECSSFMPRSFVQLALSTGADAKKLWSTFEERIARDNVATAQKQPPASQCPACLYAEVYDLIDIPKSTSLPELSALVEYLIAFLAHILAFLITCLSLLRRLYSQDVENIRSAAASSGDPTQGEKFICRNPQCRRISCLRCLSPWVDIHSCYQSSRQALQAYIESTISNAVKRTCPKCNLSFVKSSGCNKLVCVCGYSMCYVCRQDVGKEGYSHFCPHFRSEPGETCRECERCDLYRTEDEELVIKKAKEKAIQEWKIRMDGEQGLEELLASLDEEENGKTKGGLTKRRFWFSTAAS